MAAGDLTLFNKFLERLSDGEIGLSSLVVKCALTNDTSAPGGGQTASDPRWGAGGSQNLSTNECSNGGGYTTGGVAIDGSDPFSMSGATGTYTGQNAAWTAQAGSPTDIKYAVLYEDTNKYAVGYLPMVATPASESVSLVAGNVTIKWNGGASSGTIFTIAIS